METKAQTDIEKNLVGELSVELISELLLKINKKAQISLWPPCAKTNLNALVESFWKKPHQRF